MAGTTLLVFFYCVGVLQTIALQSDELGSCSDQAVCQNGGQCVEQGSTFKCSCFCNSTGEQCEFRNWCPDVPFRKSGCYVSRIDRDILFNEESELPADLNTNDATWDLYLEQITCRCATQAYNKGYQYFSVGETSVCSAYVENLLLPSDRANDGCQGKTPDRDRCHDDDDLVACIGSDDRDYIYELEIVNKEGVCSMSKFRDCSDIDYVAHASDVSANQNNMFGRVYNGLPAGKSFSFCVWVKSDAHKTYLVSYATSSSQTNHFLIAIFSAKNEFHYYVKHQDVREYYSPAFDVVGIWKHYCNVLNVEPNPGITTFYVDGVKLLELTHPIFHGGLDPGGYLIIGRDQDAYGGGFETNDVTIGYLTLFNIWDIMLTANDVLTIYQGTGTEQGNYLAWSDLKKYMKGFVRKVTGSPKITWSGHGCRFVNDTCKDNECDREIFYCACSENHAAPKSCVKKAPVKMERCTDHDYFLQYPEVKTPSSLIIENSMKSGTSLLSVCTWFKFPPGSVGVNTLIIFYKSSGDFVAHFYFYTESSPHYGLYFPSVQGFDSKGYVQTLADDTWRHVCWILDVNKLTYYQNGGLLMTSTVTNPILIPENARADFTYWVDYPPYAFTGSLAHFNIWDFALSESSIAELAQGGHTHVGNLLAWPSLKTLAKDPIKVLKNSPLMRWEELGCTWSNALCSPTRICEGETLRCPEIKPMGCFDDTYDSSRQSDDNKDTSSSNEPADSVDVVLVSRDKTTSEREGDLYFASVFINGLDEMKTDRIGFNFFTMNALTGSVEETSVSFNVYGDSTSGTKITNFINGLRNELIVMMVLYDNSKLHYSSAIPELQQLLGTALFPESLDNRDSIALLGYKGLKKVSWSSLKSLSLHKGPTIVKKRIPLIRESCLDVLHMGATKDGIYVIYPRNGSSEITVYCDLTTNGGGWTVIQRRHEMKVSFARNTEEYRAGFGEMDGEFWLGNEKVQYLGQGQLLFKLLTQAMEWSYDLYDDVLMEASDFSLTVKDHSGLIPDGILGASDTTIHFQDRTSLPNCIPRADGAWWMDSQCRQVNLNSEMEHCSKPYRHSEMMMRPHRRSMDIRRKRMDTTTTYEQAMAICWNDNLRLCSSAEICRDGKTPYDGVVPGGHWAPISDNYNFWVQVGDAAVYSTCAINTEANWGTLDDDYSTRDTLFCCGEPREFPERLHVPGWSGAYYDGVKMCNERNKRLCSFVEVCPDEYNLDGKSLGNNWSPIIDHPHEWVYLGGGCNRIVIGDWPEADRSYVLCCPFYSTDDVLILHNPTNPTTYKNSMGDCHAENRRLCSITEVCGPAGNVPVTGVLSSHVWIPVIDNYNEWLTTGTSGYELPCVIHTKRYKNHASWGTTTGHSDSKLSYCCPKIREGHVYRSWKYDLKFNGTEAGHVTFPRVTPLQEFSICWWMALNHFADNARTLLSLWSSGFTRKLMEFSFRREKWHIIIADDERELKFPQRLAGANEYHYWCITWSGVSGETMIYLDGSRVASEANVNTGGILSSGVLVLGQKMLAKSKFDPDRSFRGVITRFNIWDKILNENMIALHSTYCGEEEGNIIAWPEVKFSASKMVKIVEGEACFPASCLDYVYRNKKQDGIYWIKPRRAGSPFRVFCNLNRAGGGWTVLGRRGVGALAWWSHRLWNEYKDGFGRFEEEFWLGHENVHALTTSQVGQLLLYGGNEHKPGFSFTYQKFRLDSERAKYAFMYDTVYPVETWPLGSGRSFSTMDRDHARCAHTYGPYWRGTNQNGHCVMSSNLFGDANAGGNYGAQWYGKDNGKLTQMHMAIRPTQEFRSSLSTIYDVPKTTNWLSANSFCNDRDSYLCSLSDLCHGNRNSVLSGKWSSTKKVPVSDENGLYANIGNNNCPTENRGDSAPGSTQGGLVFCCQALPNRDWHYGLRFGADGVIKVSMPPLEGFTACWWAKGGKFDDREWSTVFTLMATNGEPMRYRYNNEGALRLDYKGIDAAFVTPIPELVDGSWHHHCLRKDILSSNTKCFLDVFIDGILWYYVYFDPCSRYTDAWMMAIGQDIDSAGEIIPGYGMAGEITRFNVWSREMYLYEIEEMAKKCGHDAGNMISWSQLRHWISGDVTILDRTTCVKPGEKHFWYLTESTGNSYVDTFSSRNLNVVGPNAGSTPGEMTPFTLSNGDTYLQTEEMPDDCVTDPDVCGETGLTLAMWLKRKGLASDILPERDERYEVLLVWLNDIAPSAVEWIPCYTSPGDSLNIDMFHEGCDYKGPTVTLVKVGSYIFGGFSNEVWGGRERDISSHSSFLFSLYNPGDTVPVKLHVLDHNTALSTNEENGPTFGADLKIGSVSPNGPCCSSNLGGTYNIPPGYTQGTNEAKYFFTSKEEFDIDKIEVFYAFVPSEPVGIEDPNRIGDDQMTASSSNVSNDTFAARFARPNAAGNWKSTATDTSPWLQVKLLGVTLITSIETTGCDTEWVETYKLRYSNDAVSWRVYIENWTEHTFTGNNGTSAVKNTLANPVQTRYVRIYAITRIGNHTCMKLELYTQAETCPEQNSEPDCPGLTGSQITPDSCTSAGCCPQSDGRCLVKPDQALGMESNAIPDSHIMASSTLELRAPSFARFNRDLQGWAPLLDQTPHWLQVELNQDEMLTHVATQGNTPSPSYQYCESYTIKYRKQDQTEFDVYTENGQPRIFKGYSDSTIIVKNMFLRPIYARFVRLYPVVDVGQSTGVIRMELYRAVKENGTTIVSSLEEYTWTGISFNYRPASEYRFVVKTDSRTWELMFEHVPYHWTHFAFTWTIRDGIQFFKNGLLTSESHNNVYYNEEFLYSTKIPASRLFVGKQHNSASQEFQLMELFIGKRQYLQGEIVSFYYKGFSVADTGRFSLDVGNWPNSTQGTPSNRTGPSKGVEVWLKDQRNLAYLQQTSQSTTLLENGVLHNSSLGVDGIIRGSSTRYTCASTKPGAQSWWQVDLVAPKTFDVVTFYQEPYYDDAKVIQYVVSTLESAAASGGTECTEFDDDDVLARSYRCTSQTAVQFVRITTNNDTIPLRVCEVAIYQLASSSETSNYFESSYPVQKGASGDVILTTKYIPNVHTCLHFDYHMYGSNMGRLNVFVLSSSSASQRQLLWRLAGDQGDAWRSATINIPRTDAAKIIKVQFEAVAGDGYMSDIAIANQSLTTDGHCQTTPSSAIPTAQVVPARRSCYCLSAHDSNVIISPDCSSSISAFQLLPNGILMHADKCMGPAEGSLVHEGTSLVLRDNCDQNDVAFRITSTGALQHMKSLLCVYPESVSLMLETWGCDYFYWSEKQVLIRDPNTRSYTKQNVVQFGREDMRVCSVSGDESFLPVIVPDYGAVQPSNRLLVLDESTDTYTRGSLLEVTKDSLRVFRDSTRDDVWANLEDCFMLPTQPLQGSATLEYIYRNQLNKWIGSCGVISEFWEPCVHLTPDGTSSFTCVTDGSVSTLLIVRKDRIVIGGFASALNQDNNTVQSFLFSLKSTGSGNLKFDATRNNKPSLTQDGMTFAQNELSVEWTAQPLVTTSAGEVFGISDINLMAGEEQFVAAYFEVLQPRDDACSPRCKPNEKCDEITGKCSCDHSGRPPAWCMTGHPSYTIYHGANHYWSMDSSLNIIDHHLASSWGLPQGKIRGALGVNDMAIELQNDDGKLELVENVLCLKASGACTQLAFTFSFWLKAPESTWRDGQVFFQTGDVLERTGFFMLQGTAPGQVVFKQQNQDMSHIQKVDIKPDLWSMITVTYQTLEGLNVFINGESVVVNVESTPSSVELSDQGKFVLGNGGQYDDLAIWYRALSEEEIKGIYNYYYKDPPILITSLNVEFTQLAWSDQLKDKESIDYSNFVEQLTDTFETLFPDHNNINFVFFQNWISSTTAHFTVKLVMNGSEYELIQKLEKSDLVDDVVFSNVEVENVPNEPLHIIATPAVNNILLEWDRNTTRLYQGFVLTYLNHKTNETRNVTMNSGSTSYIITNLTGYTNCTIYLAVYTLAGLGKWDSTTVLTVEDVPDYAPEGLTGQNASSTELSFQWDAVALQDTYQSIRTYIVYVAEADNPSVIVQNITVDSSTLAVNITNLRKFKTYTLFVKSYSIGLGIKSLSINLTTAEDLPDAPPQNVTAFNSSSRSIRLQFKPVPKDLLNGILRGYRVFYYKTRDGHSTTKNFTIEKAHNDVQARRRKRSTDEYFQGYPLYGEITGLQEFTNYTIQIQAYTIGAGVLAEPYTTLTGEDVPNVAPPNVTARNTSSTSILLEWDLMAEDDRNGILLGYVIYYNRTSGTETAFVHKSTDLFFEITGLERYTIYQFELTAFTSIGEGNRSTVVYCRTDEDRPCDSPQDISGAPLSMVKMGIFWSPVPYDCHDGIVLGYRFIFTTMSGTVLASKTFPSDQTYTTVSDLEIFTNYTVNMTAFTNKGDGPWASQVVLSLQLAPSLVPTNLSAVSHATLSSIPISWNRVPAELTKGYIIGHKVYISLDSVGLEKVDEKSYTREKVIVLSGGYRSSYVIEGLDFFSNYAIYVSAFTVGGESARSNVAYGETCRCAETLSTQWRNIAPYTNISDPESPDPFTVKHKWGIFPYIVNDAVDFCCKTCAAHNYSTVDFTRNAHGQPSEVENDHELRGSIDGLTDMTFPVSGYIDMSVYHQLYKYTPLVESPGSAFLIRKEKSSMSGVLIDNIFGNWALFVLIICLALASGAIMWHLERGSNPEEFPPSTFKGTLNGFWWAYVSMTTVGYGDKSPQTIAGRIFAIIWVLTGLVITGIMVGDLASSLTVSVSSVERMIYGTKVGALATSPDHRLGIRLNAKMDIEKAYYTLDELQQSLLIKEVDGILLDGYVVGSRKDLFAIPELEVNRVKDYKAAFGIVWSGRAARLKMCLNWYTKARKTVMFDHVVENLVIVNAIKAPDVGEEMQNLFDPTSAIYTKTLYIVLACLGVGFVMGTVYEIIRRRRLALKVKPQRVNMVKENRVARSKMKDYLQDTFTNLTDDIRTLRRRHFKQIHKFLSWNAK